MPKNNNKTYSLVACKISFLTFNFHGLILDGQDNLAVEQIAKKRVVGSPSLEIVKQRWDVLPTRGWTR